MNNFYFKIVKSLKMSFVFGLFILLNLSFFTYSTVNIYQKQNQDFNKISQILQKNKKLKIVLIRR